MVGGLVSLPACAPTAELKAAVAVCGAAVLRGGLSRSPWTGVGSWQDVLCGGREGLRPCTGVGVTSVLALA